MSNLILNIYLKCYIYFYTITIINISQLKNNIIKQLFKYLDV